MKHAQLILLILVCLSSKAFAARSSMELDVFEVHSLGFALGMTNASQDDFDAHMGALNSGASFGSAYELDGFYQYRLFDSMFSFQLRYGLFTQLAENGLYKTKLNGYTIFPILKFYAYEHEITRLFLLVGYGYGSLKGFSTQPTGEIDFEGTGYGAMVGVGGEWCTKKGNCVVLEVDYRQLPIAKNEVTSVSGTMNGLSQYTRGREVEYGGVDLETTMSGVVSRIGYLHIFDSF